MGKRSKSKQGASLRAKKRADVTHQQLEQSLAETGEQNRVESKKDDELFVLDTDRKETKAGKRRASDREASKKRKYEHSEREARQIQKSLKAHGTEGVVALAERGAARMEEGRTKKRKSTAARKPTFDLWDKGPSPPSTEVVEGTKQLSVARPSSSLSPPGAVPNQLSTKPSKKQVKARKQARAGAPPQLAVEVAHPGQSYHPDKEHHQDAIGEALSIEIRRNEAVEYKAKPIGEGMTAFTRECIVESGDSSDEDSSDDEEEGGDADAASTRLVKRKGKLTRAERNKQKRVVQERTELKERRKQKQFLHQANEVHITGKDVRKDERAQGERRAETAKLKAEKRARPLGKDLWSNLSEKDPIRAPSLPVALTEELMGKKSEDGDGGGSGLRTITPKGSLVTDRLESMVARKMISKKKEGGRRIVQGKKRPKVRGGQGTEYLLI